MPNRRLKAIDDQISALWKCYRLWADGGTSNVAPWEALAEIDVLLTERHALATGVGELANPLDSASAVEWGPADTGQQAA